MKILKCLCLIILCAAKEFAQESGKIKYRCKISDKNNKICTKEYFGVCGWFKRNIKCFKYPCAKTYGTFCQACSDPKVAYVTNGVCLKDFVFKR